MKSFQGFPTGKTRTIPIPSPFFTEILPVVDDINLLKVLLHFFRALDQQDGTVRFLRGRDLIQDTDLLAGLVSSGTDKTIVLCSVLESAETAGYILKGEVPRAADEAIYFLNTARGRDALAALQSGKWTPSDTEGVNNIPPALPDIFHLYEGNIGPITPMIADILQEAEKLYPRDVIQYAFEEAVKQNARSWKYIDAILRNWHEKGSHGKNSRDSEKDRRKYIEGEYAEFINHE